MATPPRPKPSVRERLVQAVTARARAAKASEAAQAWANAPDVWSVQAMEGALSAAERVQLAFFQFR